MRRRRIEPVIFFAVTVFALVLTPISKAEPAPKAQGRAQAQPQAQPQAGSQPLGVDEAMEIAMSHSPEFGRTRARAELASWSQNEALSGLLPTLTAGGHYLFLTGVPTFNASFGTFAIDSVPPLSPSLDGELTLRLPLFDGFRNVDRLRSAGLSSRAADLDVEYGSFSLREQVRLAFYGVIEAQALAQIAAQDVKDLQDHARLIEDQLRVGIVKRVDLMRVQTQLSIAQSEQTNADDEVAIHREQLAQLLGLDGEGAGTASDALGDRPIQGELPVPCQEVLGAIQRARPQNRPDIEALEMRAEAASDTHSSDAKWWVPSLAFLGSFDTYRSDEAHITAYVLGLQLSWNIFDGLAAYSRAKEALASERVATETHELGRLQARTDYETYRRRYQYNLQKFKARQEDVERSLESVRLVRAGFRAGSQTNTDVLDAEQDLFNSRGGLVQAQYGAFESLIRFELSLGRSIAP